MTAQYLFDTYAQESFDNSRDHGFWEDKENRNKDEMVMLMINELSECQEAYRSSKHHLDYLSFEDRIKPEYHNDPSTFASWYKDNVKGCTGEELADIVIRIFDYMVGWKIKYIGLRYFYESSKNFSSDLLRLVKLIFSAGEYENGCWDYSLSAIVQFADDWNIDLEYHIKNKQRYNRTRPYKHNKLF